MSFRLLALLVVVTAFGCRRFDVCGTAERPCDSDTGAENLGGAGGRGTDGENACSATHANCDRSTLNGCETDLRTSPRHCGACDQECIGVCTLGACVPFRVRVPELYESMANVLVTESAAYFMGRPSELVGAGSVGRYDLESGEVTWIEGGGWSDVTALAATDQRLYVLADDLLYSMPLPSGEVRDEGLEWAESVSATGTMVAAAAYGEAYVRNDEDGAEFALVPGDGYVEAVAATRSRILVARDASGTGFSVEEIALVDGARDVIATSDASVRSLAVDEFDAAYVTTESELGSGTFALRRIESPGTSEPLVEFSSDSLWLLTTSPPALGGQAWVGTYSEGSRKGLRMATFGARPFFGDWPTVGVVGGLSAGGTELWFVDPLRDTLVSIDLEAMIEPTVAAPPTE